MTTRAEVLDQLFPSSWKDDVEFVDVFGGSGSVGEDVVRYIGVENGAEVGGDHALVMARMVLDTIKQHPRRPLLFSIDTQGQRLRRHDELLGLNGYMAHLAKCIELARHRRHPILSLVYGQAVSGGYLAAGMMADACYALVDAEIKVMNLPAMSRITKIPLERLEQLAQQSPVFSPGVENYLQMGHLQELWREDLPAKLAQALALVRAARYCDHRMSAGSRRGGRNAAYETAQRVENDG